MTTFKGENCGQLLNKHGNELNFLLKFLQNPAYASRDIPILQVSAANISWMILYILYFTLKDESIFHCDKLIFIEISSDLLQYIRHKKLFMSSYLIFSMVNCYAFPWLYMCKKLNYKFFPCHISHTMFFYWNNKAIHLLVSFFPWKKKISIHLFAL